MLQRCEGETVFAETNNQLSEAKGSGAQRRECKADREDKEGPRYGCIKREYKALKNKGRLSRGKDPESDGGAHEESITSEAYRMSSKKSREKNEAEHSTVTNVKNKKKKKSPCGLSTIFTFSSSSATVEHQSQPHLLDH